MKSYTSFFAVVMLFASPALRAQEFAMPPDITKVNAGDCDTYRKDIMNCISWLLQTPFSKDKDKRHVADAFLLTWISHCPEVSIDIKPYVDKFYDVNPEFVSLFMGAWAKYQIEKVDKDELNGNLAAVKSIIDHYVMDKEMARSAYMDKLLAIDKKGKLKEWVSKEMKAKY